MEQDAVHRVIRKIHDYLKQHGRQPARICVSQELARQLDAEADAREEKFSPETPKRLKLLSDGSAMWVRGILVVADLDERDTLRLE